MRNGTAFTGFGNSIYRVLCVRLMKHQKQAYDGN